MKNILALLILNLNIVFRKTKHKQVITWLPLQDVAQLEQVKSSSVPSLLFKHSTRCHISVLVKKTLESEWDLSSELILPYYLDLLSYRDISNKIANEFSIAHESPQAILIKDGKVIYSASHSEIDFKKIKQLLSAN